jgi:hypothetical protein
MSRFISNERSDLMNEMLASLKALADALNMTRILMKEQETRDLAAALVADARAVIAKAEGR